LPSTSRKKAEKQRPERLFLLPLSFWILVLGSGIGGWLSRAPLWGAVIGLWTGTLFRCLEPHTFESSAMPLMTMLGAISGYISHWWTSPPEGIQEVKADLP